VRFSLLVPNFCHDSGRINHDRRGLDSAEAKWPRVETKTMITIHPFGLATLIDNREPLDLIDVRTEKEFKSFHIAGARSVPLKKLSAPKVLQDRKSATTEPLYIIGGGRVRASLAAGILTGGGCCQAVVVDGGMDAWISQGLSVVRKKRFWSFPPNTSEADL
jgi:rhodanese-related sulfurtransferase